MQIDEKNYKKKKIKTNLKKSNFLLFAVSANQNSQNWLLLEQNLHRLLLTYNKICNNTVFKILQNSILKNFKNITNSTVFFLKEKPLRKTIIRNNLVNALTLINFTSLLLKLNRKIHTIPQLKKINSYNYKKSIKIAYQFWTTTLKILYKTSEQCDSNT